ncbi:MAG: hypothetical protein JO185_10670 [Acidobacteriaceae bacterium]|nr:hypothetical protein [Acidobacteriaceae bacterium]
MSVGQVFIAIRRDPGLLLRSWNWKSACFSAAIHAAIYLFTNLKAGWRAGLISMLVEAIYRMPLSGLCGSFTQAFRNAEPAWAATGTVMICLPVATHSVELLVHWLQGAPRLWTSLTVSVSFTIIASLFNLYAMRRGILIVGREGGSVGSDLRQIPAVIIGFLTAGPLALYRSLRAFAQLMNRRWGGTGL